MRSIPEQLTEIYLKHEDWHAYKLSYAEAIDYHTKRFKNGEIQVYIDNGEVLGYYQRHFLYNACFLDNGWIKKECRLGKVFKELRKKFFETLPDNITHIFGHRDKYERRIEKVKIIEWRKHHG